MKNRIDNLFVYQIVGLSNYGILEDGRIFEIIKHENGYETAVEIKKEYY